MEKFARGIWSDQQILDRLQGRDGSPEVNFRGDVIRGGAKLKEVTLGKGSSVILDRFADIQRTGRFVLNEELDWLLDQIKPHMLLRMEDAITVSSFVFTTWNQRDALQWSWDQWDAKGYTWDELDEGKVDEETITPQFAEFSLGVFIPSTPRRSSDSGSTTWDVEGYDRTVVLKEDSLTEPKYFAGGTKYLDAVQDVLVSAGAASVMLTDYVDTVLPADREFEIGTKKLDIVNAMLEEINFNKIYCDVDGNFIISAYKEPSPARIDFKYAANELSVISRNTASELDLYNVPNVFIGVCSNPDLDQDYVSVYTNDNPISRLSTVRRGRRIVSEIYQFDQIASQADLDAAVVQKAFEANQVNEELIFSTALMPTHGNRDTLEIDHPDTQGTFVEYRWVFPLDSNALMEHNSRRLVIA